MAGSSYSNTKPEGAADITLKRIRKALYSAENYKPLELEIGLLKNLGWGLWSENLRMAWADHWIEDVGTGAYPMPTATSESTEEEVEEVARWLLMNAKAITILKRGITLEHNHLINGLETAAEMYRVLKARFEKYTELAAADAFTALGGNRWDPGSTSFEENLCYIQGQINLLRCFKGNRDELIDLLHSVIILNSLPDEWDSVKATLYSMDKIELSTVIRTTKRMDQAGVNGNGLTDTTLASKVKGKGKPKPKGGMSSGGIRCKNCKKMGHIKANCWARGGGK